MRDVQLKDRTKSYAKFDWAWLHSNLTPLIYVEEDEDMEYTLQLSDATDDSPDEEATVQHQSEQ